MKTKSTSDGPVLEEAPEESSQASPSKNSCCIVTRVIPKDRKAAIAVRICSHADMRRIRVEQVEGEIPTIHVLSD